MEVLNKLNTNNARLIKERLNKVHDKSCGLWKDTNINHYKDYKDLDMQIYGIWLDAINISALRHMRIPRDILDDFYYEHKGKFEE